MNPLNAAMPMWVFLVIIASVAAFCAAWDWFRDHYEPAWHGRLPRFTRRWYGTGARVCFKADADLADPAWFQVLEWGDDHTDVPWVLLYVPDDEEFPACWCPVTDLAPYALRRLHPWVFRYRWLRIPLPFGYMPVPHRAGYAEDGA